MTRGELFIPSVKQEDLVEQLLIEYQKTPNPQMMKYYFEEKNKSWFCPCGQENSKAVNFCGICGASRNWLREYTSESYLIDQIIARKGEENFKWQKIETRERLHEKSRQEKSEESQEKKIQPKVKTRLADYEESGILHVLQYNVFFATKARRISFLSMLTFVLLSVATLLVYILA